MRTDSRYHHQPGSATVLRLVMIATTVTIHGNEAFMTEQKRLRGGLVGCDAHGRSLAVALTQSAAWQLVAAAAGPILPFPSIEELLAGVAVDAVVLATPLASAIAPTLRLMKPLPSRSALRVAH